jgi:uncharacterized protein YecT (DUF1311 family)
MAGMETSAWLLVCGVGLVAGLSAQPNAPIRNKVLTAEQQQRQQETTAYLAERHRLQQQANQAFDAEMIRATRKDGDCPGANSTREEEECLSKQSDISARNYEAFAAALRSLLTPSGSGQNQTPSVGPGGPTQSASATAAEFEKVEQLWIQYRDQLCSAAFHQGGGGTIAPVLEIRCHQQSLRNHMRDLDETYGLLLSVR